MNSINPNRLSTVDGETLMSKPLQPLNLVVDTLISHGLHIMAGSPKVGKSWLALWLAVAVAKGEPVWNLPVKQGTTLYLCLEDSPADKKAIQQRAKSAGMTVTGYLTTCALGKEIVRVEGLNDLLSELKAQGRNLNQLTTLANMGRISILRGKLPLKFCRWMAPVSTKKNPSTGDVPRLHDGLR